MKIDKKTIIIIAIVAVIVFLLLKKRKQESGTSTVTTNTPSVPILNPDDIEDVISYSGMNSTEASKARSMYETYRNSNSLRSQIEEKAIKKGYTFAQMICADAMWVLYIDNDTQTYKEGFGESQKSHYRAVQDAIKSM